LPVAQSPVEFLLEGLRTIIWFTAHVAPGIVSNGTGVKCA
jgi:hypothetical protein